MLVEFAANIRINLEKRMAKTKKIQNGLQSHSIYVILHLLVESVPISIETEGVKRSALMLT